MKSQMKRARKEENNHQNGYSKSTLILSVLASENFSILLLYGLEVFKHLASSSCSLPIFVMSHFIHVQRITQPETRTLIQIFGVLYVFTTFSFPDTLNISADSASLNSNLCLLSLSRT